MPDADAQVETMAPQDALAALAAWSAEHTDWPISSTFEGFLRATFARATKTYNAAVLLTREGYGPQAGMLARSLFEDMVVAYWMTYARTERWVVERLKDRRRYSQLLMRNIALKHGMAISPDEHISDAELKALQKELPRWVATYGRGGETSWWVKDVHQKTTRKGQPSKWVVDLPTRSLRSLVGTLEQLAAQQPDHRDQVIQFPTSEDGHSTLRQYLDIAHSFNNLMLHHSIFSLELHIAGAPDDPIRWNEEPSEDWVRQNELALFWIYGQLILLMCQRLNPDLTDEAAELFDSTLTAAYGSAARTSP